MNTQFISTFTQSQNLPRNSQGDLGYHLFSQSPEKYMLHTMAKPWGLCSPAANKSGGMWLCQPWWAQQGGKPELEQRGCLPLQGPIPQFSELGHGECLDRAEVGKQSIALLFH